METKSLPPTKNRKVDHAFFSAWHDLIIFEKHEELPLNEEGRKAEADLRQALENFQKVLVPRPKW